MIPYRVFTAARDGSLHYGSRLSGIPAKSLALGSGVREVTQIVEAHGLEAGDLIYINNSWIHLLRVREPTICLGMDTDFEYLPSHDTEVLIGGCQWGKAMIARLLGEAAAMEKDDEPPGSSS